MSTGATNQSPSAVQHIVFIAHRLEGGIGANIVRLSESLVKLGNRVSVWLEDIPQANVQRKLTHVKLRYLKTTHPVGGVIFFIALALEDKPDIIVTSVERTTRLAINSVKLIPKKPRIFACVHNFYSQHFNSLKPDKKAKRINRLSLNYPNIEGVIFVSNSVKNDFVNLIGNSNFKNRIIYNPVHSYPPSINHNTNPFNGKPRDGLPTILYIGRLVKQKNIPFLLDCFKTLLEHKPCQLVLVGEGPERRAMEQYCQHLGISDWVEFTGLKDDPRPYLEAADVMAVTSLYEGFGNVIIESLYCGTPVVATACGGPNEILTEMKFGKVVPQGALHEFVDWLLYYIEHKPDPLELKRYAIRNFSSEKIALQYLDFFTEKLTEPVKEIG